jgi:RNA polymerase sigma factor (sigma-70 family)
MTLEEYQKAFKAGDNEPMRHIFEEYGAYCVENLQRKTSCGADDAKDAFIEAVMNFRQRILDGKLTELSNLRSYLYTTCINMQLARRRAGLQLVNHQERIKTEFYQIFNEEGSVEVAEEEQEQLFKLCMNTLHDLGEKCGKLLRAFYVSEQSLDEIVTTLDYNTKDVVKTTKSRCLKKWRERIAEQMKLI